MLNSIPSLTVSDLSYVLELDLCGGEYIQEVFGDFDDLHYKGLVLYRVYLHLVGMFEQNEDFKYNYLTELFNDKLAVYTAAKEVLFNEQ